MEIWSSILTEKVSFLINPRYNLPEAEGSEPCPFRVTPVQAVFRGYKVGGVYEIEARRAGPVVPAASPDRQVGFMNITGIGRRLRILPQPLQEFSVTPLTYDSAPSQGPNPDGIVFPGLSARCRVLFNPVNLNDLDSELTLKTEAAPRGPGPWPARGEVRREVGDFKLPVLARRRQPKLVYEEIVEVGKAPAVRSEGQSWSVASEVLAGRSKSAVLRVRNVGGEGPEPGRGLQEKRSVERSRLSGSSDVGRGAGRLGGRTRSGWRRGGPGPPLDLRLWLTLLQAGAAAASP